MNPSRFIAVSMSIFLSVLPTLDAAEIDGRISVVDWKGDTLNLQNVQVGLYDAAALLREMKSREKAAMPASIYFDKIDSGYSQRYEALHEKSEYDRDKLYKINADPKHTRQQSEEQQDIYYKNYHDLQAMDEEHKENFAYSYYGASSLYYFHELPPPIQGAKTDVDGHFTFQADKGTYAVVATTSIQGKGAGKQKFYWMYKVTVEDQPKITVLLNNDNQTTIKLDETQKPPKKIGDLNSLIHTITGDFEEDVYREMAGHDLPWLLDHMRLMQNEEAASTPQKEKPPESPQKEKPPESPQKDKAGATPQNKESAATLQEMKEAAATLGKERVDAPYIPSGTRDDTYHGRNLDEWVARIADPDAAKSEEAIASLDHFLVLITEDVDSGIKVNQALIRVHRNQQRDFINRVMARVMETIAPVESDIPDLFEYLGETRYADVEPQPVRTRAMEKLLKLKKLYPAAVKKEEAKYRDPDLGSVTLRQEVLEMLDE